MLASDDHRSSEARQYLEKALQIDPTSRPRTANWANSNSRPGTLQSRRPFEAAAELRPEDPTALFELGEAMEKSGDWPERGMRSNRV